MKIVVIDNDNIFLNRFIKIIEPMCSSLFNLYEIQGYNAYSRIEMKDCDLVFLDIDLDDDNGIDIAKKIRMNNKKTKIIFVTSKNHLVYNALTVQPFYFIRKNQLESDLSTAFLLLKDVSEDRNIYTFQYNGIEKVIYTDEIAYIDINDHLCSIHMTNKQEYHFYKSLSQIVKEINDASLCQIHKKYYINLKYVKLIKGNIVKLLSNDEFVIGRKYKEQLLKTYREFGNEG